MTFSILAKDPQTGELGAAAATGNLAVGAWVIAGEPELGMVASQGFSTSTIWKTSALKALGQGNQPENIISQLVENDSGSGLRQLIILSHTGDTSGWTGAQNTDFKQHICQDNLAIAGNWLASKTVLSEMKSTFLAAQGNLAMRLLAALDAGQKAGADSRGTWSAALKVVSKSAPPLDLRIDYSENPISDLTELHKRTLEQQYSSFLSRVPTLENPDQC